MNTEGDTVHLSVLAGFHNLRRAVRYLQLEEALERIIDSLSIGYGILHTAVRSIDTVRPSDNAFSLCRFLCGNRQPVARRFLGSNRKLVSAYGELNARIIGRKLISRKDIIAVRQRNGVFRAVPFKLNFLCAPRRFGKEARQLGVLLHTCRH